MGDSTSLITLAAGQDYPHLDACFSPAAILRGIAATRLPCTGGRGIGFSISAGSLLLGVGLLIASSTRRRGRQGAQRS